MSCKIDITTFPILLGCPGDQELFLVRNAIGGYSPTGESTGWGWRSWAYIKACLEGQVIPPYVGVVDRGNIGDPVSGTNVFQDDSLKNLGASNNNEIQIVLAETLRSSFGDNKSFDYDFTTGTVTLFLPEEYYPGSSLWIDRNQ